MHYKTTGPKFFNSAKEKWIAFVAGSGTGGTLAGVSKFLKEKNPATHFRWWIRWAQGMYSHFKNWQIASSGGSSPKASASWLGPINFKMQCPDEAVQVNDQEMITMLYIWLSMMACWWELQQR